MSRFLIGLIALTFAQSFARADTVTERSGREWEGTLEAIEDSVLVFRTPGGQTVRVPRSAIEKVAFGRGVVTPARPTVLDRAGRPELAVFGTCYGALNGIFLATVADFGADGTVLSALAGGATGFYVPWNWSSTRSVSNARASYIAFGGSWGMWQGIGWPYVLFDDPSGKGALVAGMVTGASGTLVATYVTERHNVSSGDYEMMSSMAGWTSAYGLWGAILAEADGRRVVFGSILAAGDLGVLTGLYLARRVEISTDRVRLINLGGGLGALAGTATVFLANVDDGRTALSAVMGGATAGLIVGWLTTRDYDKPTGVGSIRFGPTLVGSTRPVPGISMGFVF